MCTRQEEVQEEGAAPVMVGGRSGSWKESGAVSGRRKDRLLKKDKEWPLAGGRSGSWQELAARGRWQERLLAGGSSGTWQDTGCRVSGQ